jgi:hypothetical protein
MTRSLAQVNLAWMRYPLDDSRMADLRDEIDRINALGDRSPGCVWRFTTKGGAATDVRVLDDPRVLFNLTVWRSVEDLRRYVYHTEHAAFFRRRREWFVPPLHEPVAMWWVAPGEPSERGGRHGAARPAVARWPLRRGVHPETRLWAGRSTPVLVVGPQPDTLTSR